MLHRKSVLIVIVLGFSLILGLIIISSSLNSKAQSKFGENGYILTNNENDLAKKYFFAAGTNYKNHVADCVEFKDIQGENSIVPVDSFVHYDDGSISSLQAGVILNLDELDGNFVNNYSLPKDLVLTKRGESYSVENSNNQVTFDDFIYKLNDNKVILVSKEISVQFSPSDIRKVDDYIEVNYVDEGIVELVTQENDWKTISADCVITLANGSQYNTSQKKVYNNSINITLNQLVVNSDNNIQLAVKQEKKIPVFNITAVDGTEGTSGENGNNGEIGEIGENGIDGENGFNGSEGLNGVNGGNGNSGNTGAKGVNGVTGSTSSAGDSLDVAGSGDNSNVDPTENQIPVFNITSFEVTAYSVSANILIENDGNMYNDFDNTGSVKIYEVSTGKTYNVLNDQGDESFDFANGATEFNISYTDLKPDMEYRLIINAPYMIGNNIYKRDFVNRSFYTDSLGVFIEKDAVSTDSIQIKVSKKQYSLAKSATVYLLTTEQANHDFNIDDTSAYKSYSEVFDVSKIGELDEFVASFSNLSSDTEYVARIVINTESLQNASFEDIRTLSGIQCKLKTLKEKPVIGSPIVNPNRLSGCFEMQLSSVTDVQNGIFEYRYQIYSCDESNGNAYNISFNPIKVIKADSSKQIDLYIDGNIIERDKTYVVKVSAEFYDNEKIVEYITDYSSPFIIKGSSLPSVYIERKTTQFNEIDGSIIIVNTAATIDYDKGIDIEVESPGVYYKKVTLNKDEMDITSSQTSIPFDSVFSPINLKCDSTYRFTVYGEVDFNDGNGPSYRMIGVATESTPAPKSLLASWSYVSSSTSQLAKVFKLSSPEGIDSTYEANSLSEISFSLFSGSDTTQKPISTFTEKDKYIDIHKSSLKEKYYDNSAVITEDLFGVSANQLTNSNYTIVVSKTYDQTKSADQTGLEYITTFANEIPVENNTTSVVKSLSPPDFPSDTNNSLKIIEIDNGFAADYGGTRDDSLVDNAAVGFKVQPIYDNYAKLAKKVNYYVFDKETYEYYYDNANLYSGRDPIEAKLFLYNVSLDVNTNDTFLPAVNIFFDGSKGESGQSTDGTKYSYAGSYVDNGINSTGMSRGLDYYFVYTVDYVTDKDLVIPTNTYPYDYVKYTDGLVLRSIECDTVKIAPTFVWYPVSLDSKEYKWKYKCSDIDDALENKSLVVKNYDNSDIVVSGGPLIADGNWYEISLIDWKTGNFTAQFNQNLKLYDDTGALADICTQPVQGIISAPTGLEYKMDTSLIDNNKLIFNISSSNSLEDIAAIKATFSATGVDDKSVFALFTFNDETNIKAYVNTTDLEDFVGKNITIKLDAYYDTGSRGFGMGESQVYALQAVSTTSPVELGNYKILLSNTLLSSDKIADSAFLLSNISTPPTQFTLTSVLDGKHINLNTSITKTGVEYTSDKRETILLKKLGIVNITAATGNEISFGGIVPSISIENPQTNIIRNINSVQINYSLSGTNSIKDGLITFVLYKKTGDNEYTFEKDYTVNTNLTTYTFENLAIDTSYKLMVKATLLDGSEKWLINRLSSESEVAEYYFSTLSKVSINFLNLEYIAKNYFDKEIDLSYSLDQVLDFYMEYSFWSLDADGNPISEVLSNQDLIDKGMLDTGSVAFQLDKNDKTFKCFPGTTLSPGTKYRLYLKAFADNTNDSLGVAYKDITIPYPRDPEFYIKTKSKYDDGTNTYSIEYCVTATDPNRIITGKSDTDDEYKTGSDGLYKIKIVDKDGNDVTPDAYKDKTYYVSSPQNKFTIDKLPNYSSAYTIQFFAVLDENNEGKDSIDTIDYDNLSGLYLIDSKVAYTTNQFGVTVGDIYIKENVDKANGTLHLGFTNFTSLDKVTKVQYTIISQEDGTSYNGTIKPTGSETTLFKTDVEEPDLQKLVLPPILLGNSKYAVVAHFYVNDTRIDTFSGIYVLE